MRARVEVTYVADDPGTWEEMYGESADNEFIDFIHGEVKDIGGGVSSKTVRVVKVDEESQLGAIAGAPWHGLPVDQRPPLPYSPETGSAPGESGDPDMVNHPPHYQTESGLEAIEVIEAFFSENYLLGTTFKYLARAGKKDDVV